jgi:chromosome segregation ATPase
MNHPNRTPVDVLKERVAALKAELAGVVDEIADLEKVRVADMQGLEAGLLEAQRQAGGAEQTKENALALASAIERQARALITSGQKLLGEAAEHRLAAGLIDLRKDPVKAAEKRIREGQEHWRKELARIQDGPTRRKRARLERDLEKLEQRLARKETEAPLVEGKVPVMPPNRGTQEAPDATQPKS